LSFYFLFLALGANFAVLKPVLNRVSGKKYTLLNSSTVTKAEVIAEIAQKTGIDKADVAHTVESFFNVVKQAMAEGENIYVRGFGSFVNKKRARKIARNISKNTAIIIDEHYVPSFKPAKVFVEKVKSSEKLKQPAA